MSMEMAKKITFHVPVQYISNINIKHNKKGKTFTNGIIQVLAD